MSTSPSSPRSRSRSVIGSEFCPPTSIRQSHTTTACTSSVTARCSTPGRSTCADGDRGPRPVDQLGRDLQLQPTASQVPLVDIVTYWMGDVAKDVFVVIVVFSIFALDVVGLAATGRLIFSFARDNIIPFSSALKKVNPQTQTPIRALATASALGLLFVAWGYISAVTGKGNSQFLLLITATATLPFIVYFLTVLAYVTRRQRMDKLPEAFDLGVWAKPVMYAALAWTLIALAALMIPKDFWGADVIVVIVLAVAASWYFAELRGRLARGEAGVEQLKG